MNDFNNAKKYYNKLYNSADLPYISVEKVQKNWLQPCYITGSDYYSDNNRTFHKIIQECGGWTGKDVLDYVCGLGNWGVYYALTGAKSVNGFDTSKVAIKRGKKRIKEQKLDDKTQLEIMNASNLDYPNESFDIVIGVGAIHHVIKYPSVFEELYRVMKWGSNAFFLENLADFSIFQLYWKVKGEKAQGGVPIYSKDIRNKAYMFSNIEIYGDDLIYSLKKIIWKKNLGKIRKRILISLKKFDDILFSFNPRLRDLGSMCYIVLKK